MTKNIILVFLIVAGLILPGSTEAQSLDEALLSLQQAIGDLIEDQRDQSRYFSSDQLKQLRNDINNLQSLSAQLPAGDRQLYARSLIHDAQLLENAVLETNSGMKKNFFNDAFEDLSLKASARKNLALASGFNGRVNVSVITKRAERETSGYVIVFNPLQYKGSEPFVRFEKLSSPTRGSLPPGRYQMIASQNGKEIRREIVTVGLSGQDAVSIEFQVQ